ncbi:MAG: hypothetical protein ABFC94_07275 [Syntrophomonas sp.]
MAGLLLLGDYIYDMVSRGRIRIGSILFGNILFVIGGLIYVGFTGLSTQYRQRGAVLRVDEDKISYKKDNCEIEILWEYVNAVNTKIYYEGIIGTHFSTIISAIFSKPLFEIEITDGRQLITITSSVERLPELIGFLKAKTGDLFDTRRIPLQYKIKSK